MKFICDINTVEHLIISVRKKKEKHLHRFSYYRSLLILQEGWSREAYKVDEIWIFRHSINEHEHNKLLGLKTSRINDHAG